MSLTSSTPRLLLTFALAAGLSGCIVAVATGQIEAPEESAPSADSPAPALVEVDRPDMALVDAGDDASAVTLDPIDHPSPLDP